MIAWNILTGKKLTRGTFDRGLPTDNKFLRTSSTDTMWSTVVMTFSMTLCLTSPSSHSHPSGFLDVSHDMVEFGPHFLMNISYVEIIHNHIRVVTQMEMYSTSSNLNTTYALSPLQIAGTRWTPLQIMFILMQYWVYSRSVLLDVIPDVSHDILDDNPVSWEWNFRDSHSPCLPKWQSV